MNKDNKLIPALRFPEFVNEGEWEEETLKNIVIEARLGGNYENAESNIGIPVIKMGNIGRGNIVLDKIQNLPANEIYDNNDVLKFGDLLFNTRNTLELVGKVAMWRNELPFALYNSNLLRFCFDKKMIFSNEFMNIIFNTYSSIKQLRGLATGSTSVAAIYSRDLYKMKFVLPKPLEQQKIASCLSSLDEVIAAHGQKLEALKEHKKGLMQNLFPQEGDRMPKWRFKEFEGDGEWVEESLENYIDLFSGIPIKSEEISDDESGIPILRGINITEGYIRHSKDIDKYFLGEIENLEKYFVKENDIVIGMDGSKVGKNVALIKKDDEDSILIQRVARIRTNKKADIKYIYHHFLSDKFRGYVDTVNTSSGIPHISSQQIKDFKIWFPQKLEEQQKTASCLSTLDELITAQAEKVEQLKLHKKGLMQGLFPVV